MVSIYALKPRFQAVLRPLAARLAAAGATANQVTVAAVVLSFAGGGMVLLWPAAGWPLLLLAPILFVRMALNAIDGMLAREHGQASRLGVFLNELGDIVSDAALYLPLAAVPGMPAPLVIAAVFLGLATEAAGLAAALTGAARRYDGPFGKSDRAFAFGAIALLLGVGVPSGWWLGVAFILMIGLALCTIVRRVRNAPRGSPRVIDLSLPDAVLWTLAGVFAVLAAATAANAILRGGAELGRRIRSWWVICLIFTAAILLGRTASIAFLGFVSFLAFKEYLSIVPTRRADRRVLFWAYLAIPIQFYWVAADWYGMFIIFIPVYMLLFLPLPMLIVGETQGFLRAIGSLHWGLMTTVFSISHMAFLLILPGTVEPDASGAGLLLYLVVLTQANDVAQYLWGKALGKRRIVPKVSPNKTWEGFAGGVVSTTVLAVVLALWLTPLSLPMAAAAGVLIGIAGFAGDVTVSALKRDLGLKDSGSMLPGHGGVLDRLDSLTYTAPLFFHFVYYFYF